MIIGEKVLLKFAAGIRSEMTVEKFIKYLQIDEKTKVKNKLRIGNKYNDSEKIKIVKELNKKFVNFRSNFVYFKIYDPSAP